MLEHKKHPPQKKTKNNKPQRNLIQTPAILIAWEL